MEVDLKKDISEGAKIRIIIEILGNCDNHQKRVIIAKLNENYWKVDISPKSGKNDEHKGVLLHFAEKDDDSIWKDLQRYRHKVCVLCIWDELIPGSCPAQNILEQYKIVICNLYIYIYIGLHTK